MKRILFLFMSFLMCSQIVKAQVGVGTEAPNKSSQLEVVATDRGILIPRVSLTSVIDKTTIAHGNVESLLVYNTNTTSMGADDVEPGYYYWFDGRWRRLISDGGRWFNKHRRNHYLFICESQ